jgi:hypothetical protein
MVMMRQLLKFSGLGLILSALTLAPAAWAQTNDPLDDLGGDNSGDLIQGSGVDFMDLIHQANRAGGMTSAEFNQRQERKINEAAADYLQRRQAALEAESSATTTETETLEVPPN